MTTLREALEAAHLAHETYLAGDGEVSVRMHDNDTAVDRALGVFRQFWNDHRDELLERGRERIYAEHRGYWTTELEQRLLDTFLKGVERVLFGVPSQGQP